MTESSAHGGDDKCLKKFRNPQGKRPLGRRGRRCEDNIKIYFGEMGYESFDWINVAKDRDRLKVFVSTVMYLSDPQN